MLQPLQVKLRSGDPIDIVHASPIIWNRGETRQLVNVNLSLLLETPMWFLEFVATCRWTPFSPSATFTLRMNETEISRAAPGLFKQPAGLRKTPSRHPHSLS
jgi:hypothetical protein